MPLAVRAFLKSTSIGTVALLILSGCNHGISLLGAPILYFNLLFIMRVSFLNMIIYIITGAAFSHFHKAAGNGPDLPLLLLVGGALSAFAAGCVSVLADLAIVLFSNLFLTPALDVQQAFAATPLLPVLGAMAICSGVFVIIGSALGGTGAWLQLKWRGNKKNVNGTVGI